MEKMQFIVYLINLYNNCSLKLFTYFKNSFTMKTIKKNLMITEKNEEYKITNIDKRIIN